MSIGVGHNLCDHGMRVDGVAVEAFLIIVFRVAEIEQANFGLMFESASFEQQMGGEALRAEVKLAAALRIGPQLTLPFILDFADEAAVLGHRRMRCDKGCQHLTRRGADLKEANFGSFA
jgi:hypothetical protein